MSTSTAEQFFTFEIIYKDWEDGSIRRYKQSNLNGGQVKRIRDDLFFTGIVIRSEEYPGTEYEIISPFAIGKIYVTMQEKKFET